MPGAYSEAAAHLAYPNCTPVPCSQFDDAFQVKLTASESEAPAVADGVEGQYGFSRCRPVPESPPESVTCLQFDAELGGA